MALTKEQTLRAAERITERGERPTNAKLRAELGEGSYSTITEHMREWREAAKAEKSAPEPEPEQDEGPEVPEEITAQAEAAATALAVAAWEASDKRHAEAIEAERTALASEFDKLRAEREQHDAEIETLDDALVRLEQQGQEAVQAEAEASEKARGELSQEKQDHGATREALAAVRAHEEAAKDRITDLQKDIKRERQQASDADERSRQQADDIARLQRELDASRAATTKAQDALDDAQKQHEAEAEEWRKELDASQAATKQHEAALSDAQQQHEAALSKAQQQHEAEAEDWRKELDAAEKALSASDAKQRAAATEVTQLKERLSGFESRLADAHATIERLVAQNDLPLPFGDDDSVKD